MPKGPSLDPADKRLAMAVADHDLAAGDFEGRHAGATRGSGAVIVWDRGTYAVAGGGDAAAALDAGHLAVELHGEKLRGGWALTRVAGGAADPETRERWVLVKVRDERADRERDVVADEPASVLSGRTLDELVADADGRRRRGARAAARRPRASGGRGRGWSARRPTGSCRRPR